MIRTLIVLLLISAVLSSRREPLPDHDASWKIFALINQFRRENGVKELEYGKGKQWQVDLWARHLERSYEHSKARYTCENIAMNFESPEELFYQWKRSPGHRKNMLVRSIKKCAVGVHKGSYRGKGGAYFGVFRGY